MALRVKEVDVGGQKIAIANLQLRPLREYREALDAIQAKKPGAQHVDEATKTVVLASIVRAGGAMTRDALELLDGEDLLLLWSEVMDWTRGPEEKPAGEPPSP